MESQSLENGLGVPGESLEFPVRLVRLGEGDQFDFVELMKSNQASGVLSVGPGFAAETRSESGITNRQDRFVEDLFSMEVRHRYFRSGDQEIVFIAETEQVLLKFWQLAGSCHGRSVHQ